MVLAKHFVVACTGVFAMICGNAWAEGSADPLSGTSLTCQVTSPLNAPVRCFATLVFQKAVDPLWSTTKSIAASCLANVVGGSGSCSYKTPALIEELRTFAPDFVLIKGEANDAVLESDIGKDAASARCSDTSPYPLAALQTHRADVTSFTSMHKLTCRLEVATPTPIPRPTSACVEGRVEGLIYPGFYISPKVYVSVHNRTVQVNTGNGLFKICGLPLFVNSSRFPVRVTSSGYSYFQLYFDNLTADHVTRTLYFRAYPYE